ncbi:sporulation protein YunB [Risungbinella massiliensis]|uniref:sporulation protein YunB n=1 Tax=Risungbinella massiliensis TaxID=1329796 RepID=UPI0005CC563B|nr:sporulation protein YunB [Risungbinella massiliensis]
MLRTRGLARRGRRKFPFRINGWAILVLILILIAAPIVWLLETNIEPVMLVIAKSEVKKMAYDAIVEGIKQQVVLGNDTNNLIEIEKDQTGKVQYLRINQANQAKVYTATAQKIQQVIKQLQDKPIEITIGQMFKNTILSEWGPDIPVEIWPKGSAKINIEPRLESKGINVVMVTLVLKIHTEMGVVVPFSEDVVPIDIDYPIAQAMVVGEVPSYFFQNEGNNNTMQPSPIPVTPK